MWYRKPCQLPYFALPVEEYAVHRDREHGLTHFTITSIPDDILDRVSLFLSSEDSMKKAVDSRTHGRGLKNSHA